MRVGLLILLGLPGSGKTTLAKNIIEQFSGKTHNFIHVCYDNLITFSIGNHDSEWKKARNSVLVKIESLVQAIKNKNVDFPLPDFGNPLKSIKNWEGDFVVIIDDNMYFKSMRYSLFQIAKKQNISFCQVFLNCSLKNAIFNNSLRPPETAVPVDVITNMNAKIEPPNCDNNWEKYSVEFSEFCDTDDIQYKLFPVLNNSLDNSYHEEDEIDRELSKIQSKKCILHQSDIALRRIIGCKVKNYFKENPKEKSKEFITGLSERKCEILSDIKGGNICFPDEILEEINSDVLEKFQLVNYLSGYF